MSLIKTVNFKPLGDDRGSLVALEANKSVPFEIKRVYYIFATKQGVSRGFHAHKNLKQLAVCVTGSCRFVLDNGKQREEITLDSSTTGLIIEDLTWREMHDFSPDCVLMVLANQYYDENDYIRDYQEFLNVVKPT
ncbi:TDP-4-oxo-6-deoxy-alpha-D-glucose-3,4-oxoisomerase [Hydrogenovibrio crunogenus]|uniref:TDP-4-oxo-6-deoxy-alpha-D-glucose-3, 4-oxoisomerase n=1 Tax=Hydrogenovibrio crunogenus TaxID=39765 RepID=A0A4P7P0P7_9GAMM|nr:FdtA/QdtA family cupin domain-containing protein [Hydrogenovibrio crunogenus]QBZ83710.1 TDP-4-oxo-6-deoxy-alpha-D-glucose-3,4-oxoisomerase [Hydrogenovibrio crunogenus]